MEGPESAAAPGLPRLYDGEVFRYLKSITLTSIVLHSQICESRLLGRLRITFSDHYPLDPPEFVFIPPSPEHMHIYSNGFICLDILYANRGGGWSPAMTISSCCLSLRSMLASATKKVKMYPSVMRKLYIPIFTWKVLKDGGSCRQGPRETPNSAAGRIGALRMSTGCLTTTLCEA